MSFAYRHTELSIPSGSIWINGLLSHVPDAAALIIFVANGPIASRATREYLVASQFHELRYATLLLDTLSGYEERRDPDARFDVPRITHRLASAVDWVRHQPALADLPLGLHGSGTAAGAALKLAMQLEPLPFAIVSRAGRTDLAGGGPIRQNLVPVLTISGGESDETRQPSRRAFDLLGGEKQWLEIPDAGPLFIEPGTLETATRAAKRFFERWRPVREITASENLSAEG